MIDNLFGTIEDIYFTIVSDTKSENQTVISIDHDTSNLQETLQLFNDKAYTTMYIGRDGNKYRLLKLAVQILNYIMHEDDGVFSTFEKEYIESYIGSKFSRFNKEQQDDLHDTIFSRVLIPDIIELTSKNGITLRPISMIIENITKYVQDKPQYHKPLCDVLNSLMEVSYE